MNGITCYLTIMQSHMGDRFLTAFEMTMAHGKMTESYTAGVNEEYCDYVG